MIVKDAEAAKWRSEHKQEVEAQIGKYMARAYRKSKSEGSRQGKYTGMAVFCGWQKKTPAQILSGIKAGESSPYVLIDDFVTYLVGANYAPHATKNYVSVVKKWMRLEDIELNYEKLKDLVDLPRQYAITNDRIPTEDELRDIVTVSKGRGRCLWTLLASSGLRVSEALALKIRDIDFSKHPVRIHVRPEIAKDRQERWAFMSDEAVGFLREYLGARIEQKDFFVFLGRHQGLGEDGKTYRKRRKGKSVSMEEIENEPISYWDADVMFSTALRNANLVEKDEHGRDVLHIHVLRKFAFTNLVTRVGREVAEAILGHKEFLDAAYRRMTIDQLGEEYLLKGMEAVSVMGPRKILTDTDMNKAVGAAFSALVGGEDEALKEVGISPELAKDIREAIVAEAKPKEPKRDIVTPEQYLTMAGWKIIYEMKDGRLMVELE